MAFKYNPLLKIGLENTGNGSGDNSQKVTKFFYATDTLENGEIAQYQGVSDADNNLINGFFYKVDVTPITIIPAGTPYFYFTKPFESDVFNIIANDRYYLIESNVFTLNNNFAWSPDNPAFFYPYQYIEPATIGNPVYCQALKQYKFITAINGDTIVCDDISFIYGGHLVGPFTFSKYINQDGQVIFASPSAEAVIYQHNNLQYGFAPIVLSPTPSIQQGATNQQITLGGNKFTRVDTQPKNSYTLPVATPNILGGVIIGSGLSIDANGVLSASGGGSSTLHIYRCVVLTTAPNSVTALSYSAFVFNNLLFINGLFNILDTPSGNFLRVVYDSDESDIFTIQFLESFPYDANFINVDDNNLISNIGGFARTNAGSDTLKSDNGSFPVGMASFNVVIPIAITLQS